MTDLLTDDPNDTGEIKRIDDLGTEPTRDLRHLRRDTTGELTENLGPYAAQLPPMRRPANDETAQIRLRDVPLGLAHPRDLQAPVIDMESTVIYTPEPTGLEGPQKPPPPLPPQPDDQAVAQPISPWDRVAGAFQATPDGELHPAPPSYVGRHRHPDDVHADPSQPRYGRMLLWAAIVVTFLVVVALAVTW